ncbi:MAG: hypothetical protein JWO81_2577 [Alphaproteobacteria bacterium]|nr:hypothetical protein [Alphaproteobacteria bacterium]
MTPRAVLVIIAAGRDDWPLQPLVEQLRTEASISLASDRALLLEQGLRVIGDAPGVSVALLIGAEGELRPAVEAVRKRRPNIHIVALAIETGTATLSLRDTMAQEIVAVVCALAERGTGAADETGGDLPAGQVLRFRTRPGEPATGTHPNLPSTIEAETADAALLNGLAAATAWAEAATRGFMEIWSAGGETPGFTLTGDSIEKWLLRLVGLADAPREPAERRLREFLRMLDHPSVAHTPIVRIADILDRDPLALKLLLIVLAPELDIRFHRLFGSLHDDYGRRQPSAALAFAIIAAATAKATPVDIRAQVACLDHLRRLRIIEGVGATIGWAEEPLRINLQVLDWLLTGEPNHLLSAADVATLTAHPPAERAALISGERQRSLKVALARGLAAYGGRAEVDAVALTGSEPGWLEAEASLFAELEIRIRAPLDAMTPDAMEDALRAVILAARLGDRQIVVESGSGSGALCRSLAPLLRDMDQPPYIVADDAAALLAELPEHRIAVVALPPPSFGDRRAAVETAIGSAAEAGGDLSAVIADRFRLPLDRFAEAVAMARSAAANAHRPEPSAADWMAGFRAAAGVGMPNLASLVAPQPRPGSQPYACLDRVVLPTAQREGLETLVEHVAQGRTVLEDWGFGPLLDARGVAALFSGESGTGKTLAAHAVASELDSDLYVVDLAKVVSKYIGETEKQLDILFDGAARAGAVLLFDEADALFGRRSEVKDAHDRYANMEVAHLLQRMETFTGLAILTTNHPENVDPAFARRLRFEVQFPRPDAAARLRIWERSIPVGPHREERLEFDFYARRFDITGGSIRQIALHAAVAAARAGGRIGKTEVEQAIRTELVRLGNYADLAQLEPRAA